MRIEVMLIWLVLLALIAYFTQDKEEGSHLSITLNEDQTVEMSLDGEVVEHGPMVYLMQDHEIPMQLSFLFGYPNENVQEHRMIIRGLDKQEITE